MIFPNDIPGNMSDKTTYKIYDMVVDHFPSGSKFVELGCCYGQSTIYLAQQIQREEKDITIHAVDIWETVPLETFEKNIKEAKVDKIVKPLQRDSRKAAKEFRDGTIDFVFVDADHTYPFVHADIKNWLPKLKDTGWMAGHDMFEHAVIRAVRDHFGKGYESFYLEGDGEIQRNAKSWLVRNPVEQAKLHKYMCANG